MEIFLNCTPVLKIYNHCLIEISEMLQVLGIFFVGGLLMILPKEKAEDFCADILEQDKRPAWVVGSVVPGTRTAYIADDVHIIEVT